MSFLSVAPPDEPGSIRWFLTHSAEHAKGGRFNLRSLFKAYQAACLAHEAEALDYLTFTRDLSPHIITQSFFQGHITLTLAANGEPAARSDLTALDRLETACLVIVAGGWPLFLGLVLRQAGGL